MKRYIKANTAEHPYLVTFGWDDGGPESGPIWKSDTDIMYATSEDEACRSWEDRYANQFDQYEGCWARLATPEEVEKYEGFFEEFPDVPFE